MTSSAYIGRFAPSPSGSLHFGSIVAALGSFLQARKNNGKWLVRIEDIDQPRTKKHADKEILTQLDELGLYWDQDIVYQSKRNDLYQSAFDQLQTAKLAYRCTCSRRELQNNIYPGTCRKRQINDAKPYASRIIVDDVEIEFNDLHKGKYRHNLADECGDFVIRRKEGLFSYHLAVVVDDEAQHITEVVRGYDLIDSTAQQIYLQKQLNYRIPGYLHLPVAVNAFGNKLSKQTGAIAVDISHPLKIIYDALQFLGQAVPARSEFDHLTDLLDWAIKHWDISKLPSENTIFVKNY